MREKVMAVAELIADIGLDAAKMEDIAAATCVPKATLYYYFEGKEDILAFLFSEVLDELDRAVGAALETGGTAARRLHAALVAYLGVYVTYPAASRALQFDLGRAARIPVIAERTDAAFLDPLRGLLEEGALDGSLRPLEHPRLVATAILGAVNSVGLNALAMGSSRRTGHVADELVSFVLSGVAA
jgi:TetR/AcrR family transcriptional regulator